MISWNTCKDDFRWDGSWRDIYISPASIDDWKTIFPFIRSQPAVEFLTESDAAIVPETIDESFFTGILPILRFRIGGILFVFHFFTTEEIECDIDPREVTDQASLDALLLFIRHLGDMTHKQVVITPENLPNEPIISYNPEGSGFRYHELPGAEPVA